MTEKSDMTDIRQIVTEILTGLHPETDMTHEAALVTDGILDSFDIVTLITEIKDRTGVTVTADEIVPEHFDTPDAICALVGRMMKGT